MEYVLNFAPIAILLFFALVFAVRGFLKSILSFGKTVISFLVAYLFGGKLSSWIAAAFFKDKIAGFVNEKILSIYDGAVETFDLSAFFSKLNTDFAWIKNLGIDVAALETKYGALTNASETDIYSLAETVASPLANIAASLVAYAGLFIVTFVLCIILTFVLKGLSDLVEKIPVVGKLNHVLGLLFGIVTGLIVVVIAVFCADAVMQIVDSFSDSFDYNELLEGSKIFKFIRDLDLIRFLKTK